jgi:hypothetical protein
MRIHGCIPEGSHLQAFNTKYEKKKFLPKFVPAFGIFTQVTQT